MTYLMQQFLEDDRYVDISKTKEVIEQSFNHPIYITSGVQKILLDTEEEGQSYSGRLRDMLARAKPEITRMQRERDHFGVFCFLFAELIIEQPSKKRIIVRLFISLNPSVGFLLMLPGESQDICYRR